MEHQQTIEVATTGIKDLLVAVSPALVGLLVFMAVFHWVTRGIKAAMYSLGSDSYRLRVDQAWSRAHIRGMSKAERARHNESVRMMRRVNRKARELSDDEWFRREAARRSGW